MDSSQAAALRPASPLPSSAPARAASTVVLEDAAPAAEPAYLAGPPLFWRLLAANLFVVLGGAVVGTALTRQFVLSGSFTPLTHALMVLAAIALSGLLTAVILHLAFRPLRALREAIEHWDAGQRPAAAARVAVSRYDDPDIVAVAQAVNGLWDRLDQHVRLLEESNRRLEEKSRELAEKTVQLERLATQVLAAQEEERRRIARELHDETMQSMAALIMGLERGLQAMPEEVPHLRAAHQTVARLRDLAVRTLDEIRHLALDLRPAVLDDHGLIPAVRWLAATQAERFGLSASVELLGEWAEPAATSGADQRLPPAVETALFRIVQEALTNVGKHARAQQVTIRLSRSTLALASAASPAPAATHLPVSPCAGEARVAPLALSQRQGSSWPTAWTEGAAGAVTGWEPQPDGSTGATESAETDRPRADRLILVDVEVEDDGIGLPDEAWARPGHMGIFNMRERAALLGGWCTVGPAPSGKGTLVRAQVPVTLSEACA
jgi:two-component system sensor histidine kinase UhpB